MQSTFLTLHSKGQQCDETEHGGSYHDKNQECPTMLAVMDAWEGYLGLDKPALDYRKQVYPKECYVSSPNVLTVGKASNTTVIAALAIWEKARIYARFAQPVDSGVCKIRTLYNSYSLLKKNRLKRINIFVDSNEAFNKFLDVSQKRCNEFDHKINDKLREQAFSNNAVGRSCKYVCSSQNLYKTERISQEYQEHSSAARKLNSKGAQLTNRR